MSRSQWSRKRETLFVGMMLIGVGVLFSLVFGALCFSEELRGVLGDLVCVVVGVMGVSFLVVGAVTSWMCCRHG